MLSRTAHFHYMWHLYMKRVQIKMAGCKREGSVIPPTITKYFCPLEETRHTKIDSEMAMQLSENEAGPSGIIDDPKTRESEPGSTRMSVLDDLGFVIKPSMTNEEVCDAISKLENGQKYKLLKDHYKQSVDFNFPKTYNSGCNRAFQYIVRLKSPCDKLAHFVWQGKHTCASSNADWCANCEGRLATSAQTPANCEERLDTSAQTPANCEGGLTTAAQTPRGDSPSPPARSAQALRGKSAHCPRGNAHSARTCPSTRRNVLTKL